MPSAVTWVILANSAQAKIFRLMHFPKLELIEELDHPESRLYNRDLVSAKPGRNFESATTARSAYEPETDPKRGEMDKFARKLATHLNTAYQKGSFQRFYLMASPNFLGMLRQHMDSQLQKAIVLEAPKDIVEQDISSIEKHLSEL
jgi:protein required for attachment to host cells